nr:MAG: DNA pilot protein [Microvirus sp.]
MSLIQKPFFTGLAAGLVGGIAGAFGQKSANDANSAQSQRQMDFQREMSNTAHQREVDDLRAAGLNPMLSVNKGASTPAGAQATMGNVGAAAATGGLQGAQIANIKATTAKTKAETAGLTTSGRAEREIQQITSMFTKYIGKPIGKTVDEMEKALLNFLGDTDSSSALDEKKKLTGSQDEMIIQINPKI